MINKFPRKFVKEFKAKAYLAIKDKEKWEVMQLAYAVKDNYINIYYNDGSIWYQIIDTIKEDKTRSKYSLGFLRGKPIEGSAYFMQFYIKNPIINHRIKKIIQTVNVRDFYANLLNIEKKELKDELNYIYAISPELDIQGVAMHDAKAGESVTVRMQGTHRNSNYRNSKLTQLL